VAIGTVLRRFPALALAGEGLVWRTSSTLRELEVLPVVLGPSDPKSRLARLGSGKSPPEGKIAARILLVGEGSVAAWRDLSGRHGPCMG
jgi:hypothetical protein